MSIVLCSNFLTLFSAYSDLLLNPSRELFILVVPEFLPGFLLWCPCFVQTLLSRFPWLFPCYPLVSNIFKAVPVTSLTNNSSSLKNKQSTTVMWNINTLTYFFRLKKCFDDCSQSFSMYFNLSWLFQINAALILVKDRNFAPR